jgi:hypothetical protein
VTLIFVSKVLDCVQSEGLLDAEVMVVHKIGNGRVTVVPALMYSTLLDVYVNKQLAISADFYLGFPRERLKDMFLFQTSPRAT